VATFTVKSAKHATLAANTVDTVTLQSDFREVEVLNRGGTELFFTVNGSAPSVTGDNCFVVLAGGALAVPAWEVLDGATVVKLISASSCAYSVSSA
jgi:hypothetical protein